MKSTQAWGWIAAGVVALGLNGFYQDGGARCIHRFAERARSSSAAVVALALGHADRFLAEAGQVGVQERIQPDRFATAVARFDAIAARQQAMFGRLEARRARFEAEKVRCRFATASLSSVSFTPDKISISCPRVHVVVPNPRVNVSIPNISVPNISIPDIRINTADLGPI